MSCKSCDAAKQQVTASGGKLVLVKVNESHYTGGLAGNTSGIKNGVHYSAQAAKK
jgi:hypothetical protein